MRNDEFKKEGGQRAGERTKGHSRQHGAKTFRRGRAIAFLERLRVKRSTILEQLEKPEFESIQQVLIGELKAMDMVINEFSQLFEIQESEVTVTAERNDEDSSQSAIPDNKPIHREEEGTKGNETN